MHKSKKRGNLIPIPTVKNEVEEILDKPPFYKPHKKRLNLHNESYLCAKNNTTFGSKHAEFTPKKSKTTNESSSSKNKHVPPFSKKQNTSPKYETSGENKIYRLIKPKAQTSPQQINDEDEPNLGPCCFFEITKFCLYGKACISKPGCILKMKITHEILELSSREISHVKIPLKSFSDVIIYGNSTVQFVHDSKTEKLERDISYKSHYCNICGNDVLSVKIDKSCNPESIHKTLIQYISGIDFVTDSSPKVINCLDTEDTERGSYNISKLPNDKYSTKDQIDDEFREKFANSTKLDNFNEYTRNHIVAESPKVEHIESCEASDSEQSSQVQILTLIYPNKIEINGKQTDVRMSMNKHDLQRLNEGRCLNDNIIEAYIKYLINNLQDRPDIVKKVHVFSSFFFENLTSTRSRRLCYDKARRLISKVNIFEKKYIFIPINQNFHWYLAIIINLHKSKDRMPALLDSPEENQVEHERKRPLIAVLDSLCSQPNKETFQQISQYIAHAFNQHYNKRFTGMAHITVKVPKQDNFSDCGVYLLHYIEKFLEEPKKFGKYIEKELDSPELWCDNNKSIKEKRKEILNVMLKLENNQA